LSRAETVDIGNCTCSEGSSRVRSVITLSGSFDGARPPNNTSWEIVDEVSKEIMLQGGNYTRSNETYVKDACVPTEGCLSFAFFQKVANSLGDLYLPDYTVYLDGEVIKEGGGHLITGLQDGSDNSETFRIGNNCGPTSPPISLP
jgi:hypothetical protein